MTSLKRSIDTEVVETRLQRLLSVLTSSHTPIEIIGVRMILCATVLATYQSPDPWWRQAFTVDRDEVNRRGAWEDPALWRDVVVYFGEAFNRWR